MDFQWRVFKAGCEAAVNLEETGSMFQFYLLFHEAVLAELYEMGAEQVPSELWAKITIAQCG